VLKDMELSPVAEACQSLAFSFFGEGRESGGSRKDPMDVMMDENRKMVLTVYAKILGALSIVRFQSVCSYFLMRLSELDKKKVSKLLPSISYLNLRVKGRFFFLSLFKS